MNKLILIASLLTGCFTSPDTFGPFWGDPCTPKPSPTTLYMCDHWNESVTQESLGYCEPDKTAQFGGECRPWCFNFDNNECPAGGHQELDPEFGWCYCTPDSSTATN